MCLQPLVWGLRRLLHPLEINCEKVTQTRLKQVSSAFIKRLSETIRDFQRLSETFRDFQRLSEKCDVYEK